MTSTNNRSRLTIDRTGPWRLYAGAGWPLQGWTMHGTVTRDTGDTGALGLSPAGVYCQVNAGAVRSLNQRKIVAALSGYVTDVKITPSGVYGTANRGGDRFPVLLNSRLPRWDALSSGSWLPCDHAEWERLNAANPAA
jgi:hypothetical protein